MTPLQRALLAWYARCGRSHLPWRMTRDPYAVLVSEFMLQQTQVDRVLPKFAAFLERLPTFEALATASAADVLRLWQGLGYNSRAVRLKQIARAVTERFGGVLPSDPASLRSLPGIGPYTAAAIRAFAFDCDDAAADTNVRRVVHRLFLGVEHPAQESPAQLDARAAVLVPPGQGHAWNSAMMDLGAGICTARAPKCSLCPLQAACVAGPLDPQRLEASRKRSTRKRGPQEALPFERTTRFARGRIVDRLRALPPGRRVSLLDLHRELHEVMPDRSLEDLERIAAALVRDGVLSSHGDGFALAE